MDFQLDVWDYLTFLAFFVCGMGILAGLVFMLGLPGRIAYARNHPDAEAINMMGWVGWVAIVPWIQAFLWAFKPTEIVDIRRFPKEEQAFLAEQARRHPTKKKAPKQKPSPPTPPTPPADSNDTE